MMLVLLRVKMEPSNVRKKYKGTTKYEKKKVLSNAMLELNNVMIESSNVRKKHKGTTKYDKRTIKCDVGTA